MAADTFPVLSGVLAGQRRSLVLWGLAVAAVTAVYVSFYPSVEGVDWQAYIDQLPSGMVEAMGYERINSPDGYLSSTVYGLLGPVLLLVFAIGTGARLIAGQEQDGTLELSLTAPVARLRLLGERLAALWVDVVVLVGVLTTVTVVLVAALDMQLPNARILAASTGLLLLTGVFGTLTLAVGAATGRRAVGLGVGAGLAVVAFMLDAIGPTVGAGWMTAVSPFSWYIAGEPLRTGFDAAGLAGLAALGVVAGLAGAVAFDRRDLMVAGG